MRPQIDFEYGKFSFRSRLIEPAVRLTLCFAACLALASLAQAQTETTGSFQGSVVDKNRTPIPGVTIEIKNLDTGVQRSSATDKAGNFIANLLGPGDYDIAISAQGYKSQTLRERILATQTNNVIPVPVTLEREMPVAEATPGPTPTGAPTPQIRTSSQVQVAAAETVRAEINTTDARRNGAFPMDEVEALPLGGTTLTRSFDELALLLPGVAPPPETQGSVAGPGVGPGVGSAGQFAVNGMRSRSNNFTVDGSDNNDEDIGVRRQGFFALVPQPIESIKEFQITTLLAPAQYGRNVGAQVNAISKSGGNQYHGSIYGFFNSSQLNAANFFDNTSGNTTVPLQGRVLNADGTLGAGRNVFIDGKQVLVTNGAGKQDSFTLGQGGLVFGGPLVPNEATRPGRSLFFFISAEGHLLNASKEESFAVPTVAQRGLFNSGATGLIDSDGNPVFPTRTMGDAIFSLFPFPNNPTSIYGENTFTQLLPNSAQSKILSGKVDGNFKAFGKPQDFVARYNFTNDWRDVPVTGGAIFSRLRPRVRTQNFSTFLNTPQLTNTISNQLRLSYGRTRLIFDEGRDPSLLPSQQTPNTPFLLNRPLLLNDTLPGFLLPLCPNLNSVCYETAKRGSTELGLVDSLGRPIDFFSGTGPIGQVVISGFSPVGVDVFNFPQRRVNNTYQLADTMSINRGRHTFAFGIDTRRTELNSDLPRNARPLAVFGSSPQKFQAFNLQPSDFAAAGAPTGFFVTLARDDAKIHLRYYQLNFFGQDQFRIRPNLSLSYGVRYEYNTVPHDRANKIENSFSASELSLLPGLAHFVDGRSQIFEPDRNNIAPRIGIAYSRNSAGGKQTVLRAGYGLYYDEILGAVISQSRNVYPTFLTINSGGGRIGTSSGDFRLFNLTHSMSADFCAGLNFQGFNGCYVVPGTLNTLNAPVSNVVIFNRDNRRAPFGLTLPVRNLQTPMAHQYGVTVEQQLSKGFVVSAAYVGTLGRNLLRVTTPNLGPNVILLPTSLVAINNEPVITGTAASPGIGGRPFAAGPVNIFRSDARSRYDSLQVQARGRFSRRVQYQASYTFSNAKDDASDVFDLAGSFALPQDSVTSAGEYAPSNFDARHRIAYNYMIDLPHFASRAAQAVLGNLQFAGTGQFQTGQPFTVNSIFDVNLDGNLTDRLNSTNGIASTGDRSQPFRLTAAAPTLRAPLGQNGQVPRNSFRGTNLFVNNLAIIKSIPFTERYRLIFRTEIFNIFNRANFGLPVRFLEAPGFGKSTYTVTPGRRLQFALKFSF